jgi:hypothetical protein
MDSFPSDFVMANVPRFRIQFVLRKLRSEIYHELMTCSAKGFFIRRWEIIEPEARAEVKKFLYDLVTRFPGKVFYSTTKSDYLQDAMNHLQPIQPAGTDFPMSPNGFYCIKIEL